MDAASKSGQPMWNGHNDSGEDHAGAPRRAGEKPRDLDDVRLALVQWFETRVPGSAPALLELRFGEAGRDALGFAVQVPHYLAQAVYPPAALALLGSVTTSTGLDLPDAELREAADRTNEAIEQQVEESAEVAELVRALEQQYDTAAESQQAAVDAAAGLLADGEAMPTADELAAQFERFLAENQDRTDPPDH